MENKEIVKNANEETNPEFTRDNVESRDLWIKKAVEELGIQVENIKVNNSKMPTEPVLSYKGKRIVWCAPRAGMLWSNYLFDSNGKVISKVYTNDDAEGDFKWLKKRIKEIDEMSKKEARATKKAKSNAKKDPSIEEKLNEALERAKKAHGSGFSLKHLHIKNSSAVADWVKANGLRLSTNVVYLR